MACTMDGHSLSDGGGYLGPLDEEGGAVYDADDSGSARSSSRCPSSGVGRASSGGGRSAGGGSSAPTSTTTGTRSSLGTRTTSSLGHRPRSGLSGSTLGTKGSRGFVPMVACACSNRPLVFVSCWLAALVVLVLPLFFTTPCDVGEWQEGGWYKTSNSPREYILRGGRTGEAVVLVGSHFGAGVVLGCLATTIFDPRGRFEPNSDIHLWVRRFIATTSFQLIVLLMQPWVFAWCIDHWTPAIWAVLNILQSLAYIGSQTLLAWIGCALIRRMRYESEANGALRCVSGFVCSSLFAVMAFHHCRLFTKIGWVERLSWSCSILSAVFYTAWQAFLLYSFFDAAQSAIHEAPDRQSGLASARRVRLAALGSLASTSTTIASFMFYGMTMIDSNDWAHWVFEIFFFVDVICDVVLALACAGLVGENPEVEADIAKVGSLALRGRERAIYNKLTEVLRAEMGPALTLAALFEGIEPDELIALAMDRFRAVDWDVLRTHPEIILNGGGVDGSKRPEWLYNLSMPCDLGKCDAFWSHSWHDPPGQKWDAISEWAEDFRARYNRSPWIWLDIVCINQTAIKEDLQCLPIFLAGCNTFLVTSGATYTERLWCCVEMYVSVTMTTRCEDDRVQRTGTVSERSKFRLWSQFARRSGSQSMTPPRAGTMSLPTNKSGSWRMLSKSLPFGALRTTSGLTADPVVYTMGGTEDEKRQVQVAWHNFDARRCSCAFPEDKERIMAVIGQHEGGVEEFNKHIHDLASRLFGDRAQDLGGVTTSPSSRVTLSNLLSSASYRTSSPSAVLAGPASGDTDMDVPASGSAVAAPPTTGASVARKLVDLEAEESTPALAVADAPTLVPRSCVYV